MKKNVYYNAMNFTQSILEYYDELYPVTSAQKSFYREILEDFSYEAKILSIGCGTGSLEHYLAARHYDVTGIDCIPGLLESATRRHRKPGASIRFFQMAISEMAAYLGKGFYSLVSCINNRIACIPDEVRMEGFLCDCRALMVPGGCLVMQMPNYPYFTCQPVADLPIVQSIRSKLHTRLVTDRDETRMQICVETSSGRLVTVMDNEEVCPLAHQDVEELAIKTGFSRVEFFSNFHKDPFIPSESTSLICRIYAD